jgi:putative FmdB family regulatory protein
MPIYEFECQKCHCRFEEILGSEAVTEAAVAQMNCPKCSQKSVHKLPSAFAVGGRGDLRESSSFHGCHASPDLADSKPKGGCGSGGCGHQH